MEAASPDDLPFPSPSEYKGNFGGFIEALKELLEPGYGDDSGDFDSVADRAVAEAQFLAAQIWLVDKWGNHHPCPICSNTQWVVSGIGQALRPVGFLNFFVTCGYCGNTMQVVPGRAHQDHPVLPDEQLQFPTPEK
jgi:hypothetical protein